MYSRRVSPYIIAVALLVMCASIKAEIYHVPIEFGTIQDAFERIVELQRKVEELERLLGEK